MASFPESEELRTPSKNTHQHWYLKNLTHPIEVPQAFTSSECIDYFGSTSGSEYSFFAKWQVALVEKAQVLDIEVDVSQPNLVSICT